MTNHLLAPHTRYLRLRQIIGPTGILPMSRSSWYAGIKAGRYPAPIKLGRMSFWSMEQLSACLNQLAADARPNQGCE